MTESRSRPPFHEIEVPLAFGRPIPACVVATFAAAACIVIVTGTVILPDAVARDVPALVYIAAPYVLMWFAWRLRVVPDAWTRAWSMRGCPPRD
jgi:hypothetical protein